MPTDNGLFKDSPQKLVGLHESSVGLTRMTKDTISDGPAALQSKAFEYLITPYVETLQIYDSLDSAFRMADMTIGDSTSWRAVAPLTGHEIISVAYKNGLSDGNSKMKIIHFMIHNIIEEPVETAVSNGFKKLIIKLVEFPAFKFLVSNQVYKTYPIDEKNTPKQRFSDIVKDMLTNIKDFSKWYDTDIEPSTSNAVNFYVPNWLPIKVINYCKKYAVSEKKNYPMYVFHIGNKADTDKPVAYFKPVYSFVDDSSKFRAYGTSNQEINKQNPDNRGTYAPTDTMDTYSFEYFDAQRVGVLSGNTEVSVDYIQDNKYVSTDYDVYLKSKFHGINSYPLYPFGNGNQWSSFGRSAWNATEGAINIKNELYNEYAHGMMSGGLKCKAMCPIYEGRMCGERAELIFNVADTSTKRTDKMMSGAWITWSISDHLIGGSAFSTIYFYNDGFIEIDEPSHTFNKINTITGTKSPESITQG
jgi:hypothetical protein